MSDIEEQYAELKKEVIDKGKITTEQAFYSGVLSACELIAKSDTSADTKMMLMIILEDLNVIKERIG